MKTPSPEQIRDISARMKVIMTGLDKEQTLLTCLSIAATTAFLLDIPKAVVMEKLGTLIDKRNAHRAVNDVV